MRFVLAFFCGIVLLGADQPEGKVTPKTLHRVEGVPKEIRIKVGDVAQIPMPVLPDSPPFDKANFAAVNKGDRCMVPIGTIAHKVNGKIYPDVYLLGLKPGRCGITFMLQNQLVDVEGNKVYNFVVEEADDEE